MANDPNPIVLSPAPRERGVLRSAASISTALAVLALGLAMGSRSVYDHVLTSHSLNSLTAIMIGMALAIGLDCALRVLRSRWIEAAGEAYDARLSEELFGRLLRTRMSAMPRAAMASSLFREFETVRDLNSTAVATAVVDALSAVVFLVALAWMSWQLALVTLVGMLAMLLAWRLQRAVETSARKAQPTLAARQSLLHESALGAEDVKLARAEGRLAEEMRLLTETSAHDGAATRSMASWVTTAIQTAAQAVQIGVLGLGAALAIDGLVSTGTLIAASILSGRAMAPCSALAAAALKVGRARSATTAVRALADAPKEATDVGTTLDTCRGEVRLQGVRFHYPGREIPALDGLDLALAPGEIVAILGPRGCGKSTLGRLLSGLAELDPLRDGGGILLDGIPISQLSRHSLRGHVGACPQDSVLFSRSLRDNIALGRPDASDDDILLAARLACADDWILRLPHGLNTPVFEQGRTLSGGERQSVGLARMILGGPRVVFLDEPTAHFDPVSTRRFVNNMRWWLQGRTAIIATHRPEILGVCHRVALMDRGRIVQMARPAEVMAAMAQASMQPPTPPGGPVPQAAVPTATGAPAATPGNPAAGDAA